MQEMDRDQTRDDELKTQSLLKFKRLHDEKKRENKKDAHRKEKQKKQKEDQSLSCPITIVK